MQNSSKIIINSGVSVIFFLQDYENNKEIEVAAEACGSFLNLTPAGYGQCVSIDCYGGKLRVHINNKEYPNEPLSIVLDKEEVENV